MLFSTPQNRLSRPRPWLTRERGECAFPVKGSGVRLFSCCRPCGGRTYCAGHRALMRGPRAQSLEALERELRRLGV